MSFTSNSNLSHLKQTLVAEENNFINLMKADKEFRFVKPIVQRIKQLKAEIAKQECEEENVQGQYWSRNHLSN